MYARLKNYLIDLVHIKKDNFLHTGLLANVLIILNMIPQFFFVPLVLNGWGEQQYVSYVVFLSILNIFTNINGALNNGFVKTLVVKDRTVSSEIIAMMILNFIFVLFSWLGMSYYIILGFDGIPKILVMPIFIALPLLIILNAFKILLQVKVHLLIPLVIALLQSTAAVAFLLFFYVQNNMTLSVIYAVLLSQVLTCVLVVFYSFKYPIFNFTKEKTDRLILVKSFKFILKFGVLSLVISSLINIYINGSKIFMGGLDDTTILLNFNLTFTLCMLVFQFVNPLVGLLFPYLANNKQKNIENTKWIVQFNRFYWALTTIALLAYSLVLEYLISIWLGEKYLYLEIYVYLFLPYFLFFESASIISQYFKVIDKQYYTLAMVLVSFVAVPAIYYSVVEDYDIWELIYFFGFCGFLYFIGMTIIFLNLIEFSIKDIAIYLFYPAYSITMATVLYISKALSLSSVTILLSFMFSLFVLLTLLKAQRVKV